MQKPFTHAAFRLSFLDFGAFCSLARHFGPGYFQSSLRDIAKSGFLKPVLLATRRFALRESRFSNLRTEN